MIGYLRTLLLFYRRHLRVQPLRELMAVVGIAAGVALLFAVQVAHHSITSSFEEVAHGVAGEATLELSARGPEGFDQRVAEEVQSMAGVQASAPILTQSITAVGPAGQRTLTLIGATEQISALRGGLSTAFEHAGEGAHQGFLLLTGPTAKAIGARTSGKVTVLIDGRTEHMTLAATVGSGTIGAAAQSPIAAAPLAIVQSLAGLPGRVTRVLIEPKPGSEGALRRALSARFGAVSNPRSIDTEAKLLNNAAASESQVTLLFSVISLVAGMILAYNALLLASEERRRFIVHLIETGTPDSMVLASLAFDALILGVAGCALGLLAGEAISLIAYHSVPGYITAAFPVGPQRVVTAQTVSIALAGGMLAAFAAAILPALAILRGSASARPEAAGSMLSFSRRLRASDRGVFLCGLALICLSVLAALSRPASTVVALVGLAAGIVICLPMTARCLLELARTVSRRSGDPAARLAVAELRGAPTRPVALLATGAIAAFLMIVIGGSVSDVQGAVRRGATDLLSNASLWVKPGGRENIYTTQPFAYAQAERRLQALGVVRSVLAWQDSFLDLPGRRVWVLGVPSRQPAQIVPSQLLEGSLQSADRRLREGGWAAISQTIAREDHLRLGQRFTLPTPSGETSFRLAATTANYGWLSGAVVMNADEHARLWMSDKATELAVMLKPGIPIARGKQLVERALPPGSSLATQTDGERRAEVGSVLGNTLSRLNDTTIVVLITTIVSVVALMMAAVWQSRGRFNSLMSIGMGFSQFARLIFYESGSLLLGGCAIGIAAGLAGQYLIDGWLQHTTGSPVQFSPAWQLGLRTVAIAVGISLVASLIAALRVTSFQPSAAFSTQ
ncbi:MAG TPA: ABC transporter permease [Solirubrobacteraceae bacterium]|jgi:putative ABC transport system permease protein|nr:ABC transporter permease [Solirubrobacteraceae bacterium]